VPAHPGHLLIKLPLPAIRKNAPVDLPPPLPFRAKQNLQKRPLSKYPKPTPPPGGNGAQIERLPRGCKLRSQKWSFLACSKAVSEQLMTWAQPTRPAPTPPAKPNELRVGLPCARGERPQGSWNSVHHPSPRCSAKELPWRWCIREGLNAGLLSPLHNEGGSPPYSPGRCSGPRLRSVISGRAGPILGFTGFSQGSGETMHPSGR
jgi:hypothetical protein